MSRAEGNKEVLELSLGNLNKAILMSWSRRICAGLRLDDRFVTDLNLGCHLVHLWWALPMPQKLPVNTLPKTSSDTDHLNLTSLTLAQ